MDVNNRSSISQAETLEQIGEFWDTHGFTDYDDPAVLDVEFTVSCAVPIETDLLAALERQAQRRGVMVETLVNLWLQQKLVEQTRTEPQIAAISR